MAEVVATFAAISSVVQLIDFSTRLVKQTRGLINASNRSTGEQAEIERLAIEYKNLTIFDDTTTGPTHCVPEQAVFRLRKQCSAEASKLIQGLEKLKITSQDSGVRTIKHGAKKIFMALRESKELDRRRKHLEELNGQLGTSILQLLMSKNEQQSRSLSSLLRCLAEMKDEMKVLKFDESLKRIHDHVLRSLSFEDIHRRVRTIPDAYPETYRWALQNNNHGLETWLKSGHGMYWISGKAGSGKSTLMKHLSRNPRTETLLNQWSSSTSKVTVAHFAFWYLGSSMQKSIEGLLRNILYRIMCQLPSLSPIAFPTAYNHLTPPSTLFEWSYDELIGALRRIAKYIPPDKEQHRFCFFIDGLDEYSGNHLDLIDFLQSMIETTNIKLCVSSRPWNAFRQAFGSMPHLQLETLTRGDIRIYAEGSIRKQWSRTSVLFGDQNVGDASTSSGCNRPLEQVMLLVEDIVSKAEGVFLWVHLVLKSILAGIAEGDPLALLRHRVREFPSDLGEFFQHILERIEEVYKPQTYQALKLACLSIEAENEWHYSSWIDYWLMRFDADIPYSAESVLDIEPQVIEPATLRQKFNETRASISACCKDLLYLPDTYSPAQPWIKVEFLHRTVHEFLSQHMLTFRVGMNESVPEIYHSNLFRAVLDLTRLKFVTYAEDQKQDAKILEDIAGSLLRHPNTPEAKAILDQVEKLLNFYKHHYTQEQVEFGYSDEKRFLAYFVQPKLLECFVMFDKYEHVLQSLRASISLRRSLRECFRGDVNSFMAAVLHCEPSQSTAIDKIHLPLVQTLLQFDDGVDILTNTCPDSKRIIGQLCLRRSTVSHFDMDLRMLKTSAKLCPANGAS